MGIRVTVSGIEDVAKALGAVTGQLLTVAQAGADVVRDAARANAPKRHGDLAQSIHTEVVEQSQSKVTIAIGSDLVYAATQEFGAVIVPKSAQALHFRVAGSGAQYSADARRFRNQKSGRFERGVDVFTKKVHIPGHPYLRPALLDNQPKMVQAMTQALKDSISK